MNPTHINKKTGKTCVLLMVATNADDRTRFAVYKQHTYAKTYTCVWTRFIMAHRPITDHEAG